MHEFEEQYLIITDLAPDGFDVCWYDTLEEAIEDYDPLTWHQKLLKVVEIIP